MSRILFMKWRENMLARASEKVWRELCFHRVKMASRAAKKKTLLLLMIMQDEELPISYERRMWARQWLLRREQRGAFQTLFQELAVEDTPGFSEYIRMPYSKFVALAELIEERYCYENLQYLCQQSVHWYSVQSVHSVQASPS